MPLSVEDVVHHKIYEDGYVAGFHDGVQASVKVLLNLQSKIIEENIHELKQHTETIKKDS